MKAELKIIAREYNGESINIKIEKVIDLEFADPKPGVDITVHPKGTKSVRTEQLGLDAMEELKDLYLAIGDFLENEEGWKGVSHE